jgi:hypothetical protein
MCVWVYVRVFIPSLPFMGLFFVLYTSIILHSVSLGESLIVRSKKTGSVWKVLNRNNYKL